MVGDYYPFGLIQAGISSKALEFGNPENKLKYNGIEYENDLGLEVYDAQLRELDGQTGRWWQIDPKTEDMEMWSPYASNYDNPIRYSDPLGDEGQDCCWFTFDKEAFMDGVRWFNTHLNPLTPVVEFATGKSMSSDLKEDKSRLATLQESMAPVPAKVKGAGALSKAEQLTINMEKGAQFEKLEAKVAEKTQVNVVEQVTVKTESGIKTKIDIVGKDKKTNQIVLTEAKSSQTAPLTKNQKKAFPEIEKTGATVVGKGKPGVPGGTEIPPTKVNIVRPPEKKD